MQDSQAALQLDSCKSSPCSSCSHTGDSNKELCFLLGCFLFSSLKLRSSQSLPGILPCGVIQERTVARTCGVAGRALRWCHAAVKAHTSPPYKLATNTNSKLQAFSVTAGMSRMQSCYMQGPKATAEVTQPHVFSGRVEAIDIDLWATICESSAACWR